MTRNLPTAIFVICCLLVAVLPWVALAGFAGLLLMPATGRRF